MASSKNKNLLSESGIRDIRKISKRYPKAEIYFHEDLDGVTSAIAMKKYLEDNNIKVVDAHVIQYGEKEFEVKKNDAQGDTMPVLVDFAHGKPMFVIHTDHHDSQIGVEKETSKQFRPSKSNVETISQIISPKDLFSQSDISLISMVDSADFAKNEITPNDVINYIYNFDKDKSLSRNKTLLGLVINKLVLAFKNKKGFLKGLVMNSQPSLLSILNNIKKWMGENTQETPVSLQKNAEDYVKTMKDYPKKNYEDGIIIQYGGGSMYKQGSFDRYTPFKNQPDADFLIMIWPMGLVQVSCNPFKKDRKLKGINLGDITKEVLSKWEDQLKDKKVSLSTIKWINETTTNIESIGFTFADFMAIYGDKFDSVEGGDKALEKIKSIVDKKFSNLTENEKNILDKITINAWDIIISNSGGHKCITNISGLNYLGRSNRPPKNYKYNSDGDDSPYVKFSKMVGNEFKRILKEKINS